MRTVSCPHLGEILAEEFLKPLGISNYRLAKEIGIPAIRVGDIVAGRRSVTADTGLRLSAFFGMSEGFWTGLQDDYDRAQAKDAIAPALNVAPLGLIPDVTWLLRVAPNRHAVPEFVDRVLAA